MLFIETPIFTEEVTALLSDEEYALFQEFLASTPLAGDMIPDTNGLRKVRWASGGKGKRGGVRIIYYHVNTLHQIRLIYIYRKGIKDNLTAKEKAILRAINARWQS